MRGAVVSWLRRACDDRGEGRNLFMGMSIDAIKSELRALPAEERRKLIAYMVALEDERRSGYAAKLAQRIDDTSPERWLTLEECERELGLSDDPK